MWRPRYRRCKSSCGNAFFPLTTLHSWGSIPMFSWRDAGRRAQFGSRGNAAGISRQSGRDYRAVSNKLSFRSTLDRKTDREPQRSLVRGQPMALESKIRKAVVAAGLGAGVLATSVPAQAGSLERGILAGLIGGVALSALAASAQAQQQSGPVVYGAVPADLGAPVYVDEIRPQARPFRQRTERPQQRRVSVQRARPVVRRSAEATKCAEVLEAQARQLGAVNVKVSSAGSEVRGRDGARVLPVNARIEYARKGQRQVREARVGCRVNTDGQVVELR
jgi:hypothetical protein